MPRNKEVCKKCLKAKGGWSEEDEERWTHENRVLCDDADAMPSGTMGLDNPLPSFCAYITEQVVSGATPPSKDEKSFYESVGDNFMKILEAHKAEHEKILQEMTEAMKGGKDKA